MGKATHAWIKIRLIDFERHRSVIDQLKADQGLYIDFEGPIVHLEGEEIGEVGDLSEQVAAPLEEHEIPFNCFVQTDQLGEPNRLGYWRPGMEHRVFVDESETDMVPLEDLEALLRGNPTADAIARGLRARIDQARSAIPPLLTGESRVEIA